MANKQPKSIQIDTYTAGIFGRTEGYADKVRQLYASAVSELLKLTAKYELEDGEVFDFDKLPKKAKDEANKILRALYSAVYNEVQHGVMAEWQYANLSNDIIIKRVFGDKVAKKESNHFARWFARNNEAMDAFLKRKEGGFTLSQRIWKQSEQLKDEMALALSVSLGKGDSAATVSRKVRQYLQEPDRLFRHVKGADGKMRWSKAAQAYLKEHKIGRGQYLSSYKNAMRMTRTETNMAYRSADSERWQRLDFVLGQHIGRGHNKDNEEDICDTLAGDYPKEFKFTGWHPQCRCISTPILATPAEAAAMRKAMKEGKDPYSVIDPSRRITQPPKAFTDWVSDNRERIENASSVPYFIKDNYKDGDLDKGWRWEKSAEEKQAELEAYNAKVKHQELVTKMGNNVYNVAVGYPEVDTSELVESINAGDYTKIEEQAKAVAHQIAGINKKLAGLKDLIEDPKMWMEAYDFTSDEMVATHSAIASKIAEFKAKYASKAGAIAQTEAEYVLDKLGWEINYLDLNKNNCQSKHKTWMVSKDAYVKQKAIFAEQVYWEQQEAEVSKLSATLSNKQYGSQIAKALQGITAKDKSAVQSAILDLQQWKAVDDVLQEALAFKTKSAPYLNLVAKLQAEISSGELYSAQKTVIDMQSKRDELAKDKARRLAKKQKPAKITDVTFDEDCFTQDRLDNAKWHIDSSDANDYFFPYAKNLWPTYTAAEKHGLWNYTEGSAYCTETLRGIVGHRYWGGRKGLSVVEKDIPAITSALQKSTFDHDVWVKRDEIAPFVTYRWGVDLNAIASEAQRHADAKKLTGIDRSTEMAKYISSKLVGKEGIDDSFMSCGNCRNTNFGYKEVCLNIYMPKGTHAAYCEPFSNFGSSHDNGTYCPGEKWDGLSKPTSTNENEVLLQRGTKLRITKVEYTGSKWYIDCMVVGQYPRAIKEYKNDGGLYAVFE